MRLRAVRGGRGADRARAPGGGDPVLEQRLNEFGDNESGEVERELRDARKKARKGD